MSSIYQTIAFRYGVVLFAACFVTFFLFYFMDSLIRMGMDKELKEVSPNKIIEFVRLKKTAAQEPEEDELPEKVTPQKAAPPPDLNIPQSALDSAAAAMSVDIPDVAPTTPDVNMVGGPSLGAAPADTEAIPMVRVQPMYPPTAAQQRIEGWVQLEFTITKSGSVSSPRVLKAHPPGIFDRAALQAIRKWKYKPKIVEGQRVERPGIKVRLTFELDNL